MEISEKDLEDVMFKDLADGGDRLRSRGFTTYLTNHVIENKIYWYRQVNFKEYGIADLVGVARHRGHIIIDVVELKNRPLKSEDFDQVLRYKRAIREVMSNTFKRSRRPDFMITPYLVGPSISCGHYIHNELHGGLYTFDFTVSGFEFEGHTPSWYRPNCKPSLSTITYANQCVISPAPRSVESEDIFGLET
jgi:hypothetical protein